MAKHNYEPTGDYVEQAKSNLIAESFAGVKAIREFLQKHKYFSDHRGFYIEVNIPNYGVVYCFEGSHFSDGGGYINNKYLYNYNMPDSEITRNYGERIFYVGGDVNYTFTRSGVAVIRRTFETAKKGDYVTITYVTFAYFKDTNLPIGGAKAFFKYMDEIFSFHAAEKKKKRKWYGRSITLKKVLSAIVSVGSVWALGAAGVALSKAVGIISTIGAIGGVIAGIGGLVVTFGMIGGSKTLAKIGSKISAIGALISIGSSISNFLTSGASKAAASTLPNYNLANSQSLNQTASLYEGVSPASWANGSNLYQNTNSVMFSSEANSFKSALYGYNVGASAATSGISSANSSFLYLTKALKLAELGFKSYEAINNLIGAFRTPNEFRDDDMVEPEDDDNKVSLSSSLDALEDAGVGVRRFYDRDVEYDLGLERGTLMSNDDSLL